MTKSRITGKSVIHLVSSVTKKQLTHFPYNYEEAKADAFIKLRKALGILDKDNGDKQYLRELWEFLGKPIGGSKRNVSDPNLVQLISRTKSKEEESKNYHQWVTRWAEPKLAKAGYTLTEEYTTKRGKQVCLKSTTVEAGKYLALMTDTNRGDEIRKAYLFLEEFIKEAEIHNLYRMDFIQFVKDASRARAKLEYDAAEIRPSKGWFDNRVDELCLQINSITKEYFGGRNEIGTDPREYYVGLQFVTRMFAMGADIEMIEAYCKHPVPKARKIK